MTFNTLESQEVYRGESRTLSLTFTDENGSAIDITGYVILFTVKAALDTDATDSNALISKSGTITDAANGLASISILSTDTLIEAGTYYYDIKYVNGASEDILGVGKFKIKLPVTNRDA